MKKPLIMFAALMAMTTTIQAAENATPDHSKHQRATPPHASLSPLFLNDIEGTDNKEAALLLVTFPPGSVDPVHRHNALVYVYMLEGSVVMQVRGGTEVTLKPGQTFLEKPSDIHVISRNARQISCLFCKGQRYAAVASGRVTFAIP
jgi:quercetin dioxygenase-like cupin family protein